MSPAVYYTLGSLPAAASPPSTYSVPATIGIAGNITTLAEIRFQADGLIRAFCLTSGTMSTAADVGNSLAIPAQSWPRKPQ